ncbi:MAG: hypothetical protein HRU08_00010 [Oleispira sp.]|nr:hypothetical protein [Oleispira sp.]
MKLRDSSEFKYEEDFAFVHQSNVSHRCPEFQRAGFKLDGHDITPLA